MELKHIEVNNFRSITEGFKITMKPRCRVLVGINESGKSNILNALSMLCSDISPNPTDIREPLSGEDPIEDASIDFIYALSHEELKKVFLNIKKEILCSDISKPLIKRGDTELSLNDILKEINEIIYEVNLKDATKTPRYWALSKGCAVLANWKKPSSSAPATYNLKIGTEIELCTKSLIDISKYNGISEEHLENVTPEYVNDVVGKELISFFYENLPECIFWKYEDKNLLPSKINLNQFSSNPDTCLPLKHMFHLAKYSDITKAFTDAKERYPDHGINNLLENVSKQATKHFRSIWKDYKSIEFYLGENGDCIDAAVKEENRHGFDRRSDGFKRFVTFLLMISAKVKNNLMTNTLLLIDEPDMGLHISAQKYLRDELIKISEKNFVVYSTHSIFMIDGTNMSRHLIVKKEGEKTFTIEVKESNIFDEEVLYNALGYSVFENLKQKNILFEGWRDKKLCQTALSRLPREHRDLRDAFKDVGFAHSKGVNFMKFITPILELAKRECFIMSDADEAAKRLQKQFNEEKLYGVWKRYDEIIENTPEITAEDFIKKNVFVVLCKKIKRENPSLPKLTEADFQDSQGVMHILKKWVEIPSFDDAKQKEIIKSIKETVFSELKPSQIEDNYYKLLERLKEDINNQL
jgi:predicted ATP-dependent endonuclease of OLD family